MQSRYGTRGHPTKYFLAKVQNVQKSRTIKMIWKKNREITDKLGEIIKEFEEFYKELYTEEGQQTENKHEEYLKYVRKIEEEDKENMEHPFTENSKQKQVTRPRWTHERVL